MKQKKIRGHNRRHKQIETWRTEYLSFDLTNYLLNEGDRQYAKIRVHPWNGLSLTNSIIPQPKGRTKLKMLNGLLDIYEDWQSQLNKLGQPYYLKIWLFEPRFSHSQVVCSIGDNVEFYENIFYKADSTKSIQLDNYSSLKTKLSKLSWTNHLDEDHYDNTEVGEPEIYTSKQEYDNTLKWFGRLLKKPHRKHTFKEPIGKVTESYSFKQGYIWVGGQK